MKAETRGLKRLIGGGCGEQAEGLVEGGGLDEHQAGGGAEVGREAGERRGEREARGGGEGELFHRRARALGHGVELADVVEFVAEKIEAVGLGRVDRVEVDDAAAHGVGAGGLADGLAVVVEGAEFFEQGLEGMGLALGEGELVGGVVLESGHALDKGGGRGENEERGRGGEGAGEGAGGAQPGEHGLTVGGGGESLGHVARIGHGLGEHDDFERDGFFVVGVEEGGVFGELLGGI